MSLFMVRVYPSNDENERPDMGEIRSISIVRCCALIMLSTFAATAASRASLSSFLLCE